MRTTRIPLIVTVFIRYLIDAPSNDGWPGSLPENIPTSDPMASLPRIPDLLTTANLCCGVGSILLASQGQLTIACGLIFMAAVFDVFDGLAARALGGGSRLGAQLDSLADMVSFGVAPAFVVLFGLRWPPYGDPTQAAWLPLILLLIPIASAWRLAKFNIDDRQTNSFLGLATPFNAMFWASLCLSLEYVPLYGWSGTSLAPIIARLLTPPILPVLIVLLAVFMLSSIPLPSLKFKHVGWKGNEVIYLLLGIGLVLVVLYGVLAVPLILALYLLSPLWGRLFVVRSA